MKHTPIKQFIFHVTVEGSGQFPFDMLRYDHCWPRHEPESSKLEAEYGEGPRRVELTMASVRDTGPNIERWNSFCWNVVDVTPV